VPFTDYISNSLCVGRRRPTDLDEQVFLFVVMKPGFRLEDIAVHIRTAIRAALSPRHVPKYIFAVPDVPMTINGKRVETIVKKLISGHEVKPSSTIQNPQSLAWFRRYRHIDAQARNARL
jgi:acetoacetyl-CoA synthetase